MKRIAFAGLGLMLTVVLAGCPPTPGLIGTWRMVYDDGFVETWTFFADGTFEWFDENGDFGGDGTWTQDDKEVSVSEMWTDDEGMHEVKTDILLSNDELSLTGSLTEFLDGVEQDTFTFDGTKR